MAKGFPGFPFRCSNMDMELLVFVCFRGSRWIDPQNTFGLKPQRRDLDAETGISMHLSHCSPVPLMPSISVGKTCGLGCFCAVLIAGMSCCRALTRLLATFDLATNYIIGCLGGFRRFAVRELYPSLGLTPCTLSCTMTVGIHITFAQSSARHQCVV